METKNLKLLLIISVNTFFTNAFCAQGDTFKSPDGKLAVNFSLTATGEPAYAVAYSGSTILKQSKLGIVRSDNDFSTNLTLDSVSNKSIVSDNYTLLHGKRSHCSYTAHQYLCYLHNAHAKTMEIIFQVSNHGVAFRYHFPGKTDTKVKIFVTIQLCQARDGLIKEDTFNGVKHIKVLLAASRNKPANATESSCPFDAAEGA